MSKSRRLAAVLCIGALGAVAASGAANAVDRFTWDPEAQPETVGTPRDPGQRQVEMDALQKALAARQVDRGMKGERVVTLTAAEKSAVDSLASTGGKYLVGVNKAIGAAVDFDAAAGLGRTVRGLPLGAMRGDGHGGFVWTAAVRSPGAEAMRAHLTGLDLPEGAELYVYDKAGHAFGPYTGRGPLGTGDLWTNTVFGERLILQLVARGGERVAPLFVAEVGVMGKRFVAPHYGPNGVFDPSDLARLAEAKAFCSYNATCVVNAACQSSSAVNTAKQAVATMLFTSGGSQYICTGQLIADNV
ncbi:MAG TPA: hypothetical protein VN923_05590, partial [Thermoanaerobaculia bacterium]|nr:hypothetical protein [Thermoanaerobaculia bacterium]